MREIRQYVYTPFGAESTFEYVSHRYIGQTFNHQNGTPSNSYTYDDLDRLNQADYIDSTDEVFTYDDLGNRLTLNNRAGNDVAYSHNVANEYTAIGGQSVSHDAAGNLSADDNGYTYQYDHDNRLTKITQDSTDIAEFTYDALGRRIEKIEYDTTNITTRYYYDGWRVLSETNAAGVNQRDYVYGNYLDEVLIKRQDTADLYYAHNHLYSPVALINASGTVVERYEYDVYGKPTIMDASYNSRTSSNYSNVIFFTGQRLDSLDSGDLLLMYYKNRIYSFNIGRFIQRNPLGVNDGLALSYFMQNRSLYTQKIFNPDAQYYFEGMNLYQYVKSIPTLETDKLGLSGYGKCGECPDPSDEKLKLRWRPVKQLYGQSIEEWNAKKEIVSKAQSINMLSSAGSFGKAGLNAYKAGQNITLCLIGAVTEDQATGRVSPGAMVQPTLDNFYNALTNRMYELYIRVMWDTCDKCTPWYTWFCSCPTGEYTFHYFDYKCPFTRSDAGHYLGGAKEEPTEKEITDCAWQAYIEFRRKYK